MSDSSGDLVLGIDGGGSTSVAWLAVVENGTHRVLGRGLAGPSNLRAVTAEQAREHIRRAVSAAFAEAELPEFAVRAACFGMAGAGESHVRMQWLRWAHESSMADRVKVVHDGESVLAVGDSASVGVALIAGTGSLVYGRDAAQREARCGGWGYLIGDEGSGYALALAGLRAAVRSADGRGPRTGMLTAFLERLGCTAVSELTTAIYDQQATREVIAALSRVVFEVSAAGDLVASQLILAGAAELSDAVRVVTQKLGFQSGQYSLAMTGGVLVHFENYRQAVLNNLASQALTPRQVAVVQYPVDGAVSLAAEMVRPVGE